MQLHVCLPVVVNNGDMLKRVIYEEKFEHEIHVNIYLQHHSADGWPVSQRTALTVLDTGTSNDVHRSFTV